MAGIAATNPRIVLAGTGSGCGKTTVVCGVLGALKGRGLDVRAFKCGPDYIDPMFHTDMLGVPSRNLDSFLCGERGVARLFAANTPPGALAVVEGVMGFYDGLSGTSLEASTSHVADILEAPVVLICSCRGKSLSLAAELQGFLRFAPNRIRGIILNHASPHSYPMYREIVETHTGLPVLGFLPPLPKASLESRHLGLVTAAEVADLQERLAVLASAAEQHLDLDRLLALARTAPPLAAQGRGADGARLLARIAVARDDAFCFYYRDNLDILARLGAELVEFSPVGDGAIPLDCDGLLLGGGYPELHAGALSQNHTMLDSVREAVDGGMPTIAECGGFMYLSSGLTTLEGQRYPMVGVIPTETRMTGGLSRFGYVTMTANRDNLLCGRGERLRAHSFHYSAAGDSGDGFTVEKPSGKVWQSVHAGQSLYAGYPHLHFGGNEAAARRFVERCAVYRKKRGGGAV